MKRVFALLVCCVLVLSASVAWAGETYDQALERVTAAKDQFNMVVMDKLPYVIPYDSTTITLEEINFYQQKIDHCYELFVVLKISTANLDEDQAYWLQNDLSKVPQGTSVYETCEENNLDFSLLSALGSLRYTRNDKKIYFVYKSSSSTKARKSHSGGEASFFFGGLTEGVMQYYFSTKIPEEMGTPEEEIKDEQFRNYIYEWLDK